MVETRGQAEEWKTFTGQALGVSRWEAAGLGKLVAETQGRASCVTSQGCGRWGGHTWLSLVGPELEAGTEIRKAGSY